MFGHTIRITSRLSIPESELKFTASRSSGPGGQNVNKVSTRVTLWFDVVNSPSLSDEERTLILSRLRGRVNRDGLLWVTSQESRSQAANRETAVIRFAELLHDAIKQAPTRKSSPVPRGVKLQRLMEKKHRSLIKQGRSHKPIADA